MPRNASTQTAILNYLDDCAHTMSSGEMARRVGISQSHASRSLKELAAGNDKVRSFEMNGGSIYIRPRLRGSDKTHVLSMLAYYGLRADSWLRNPRTMGPDALRILRTKLVELVANIDDLLAEDTNEDN